jgi:hypothetical protein
MSTPHSGAPPGPDVKRAALGREAARGSAVAVGTANRTPPPQNAQRGLNAPAGGSPLHLPDFAARFRVGSYICVFQICDGGAVPSSPNIAAVAMPRSRSSRTTPTSASRCSTYDRRSSARQT